MKEFENDNWELKARQLADAFQPTPEESVWLNVEAALKQKKNRRGIFFWLFSFIVVAVVVYGGITFYLFNAGDQYESLNKNFEKSKVETVAVNNNSSAIVKSVPTVTLVGIKYQDTSIKQVAAVKTVIENSPLKFQEQKIVPSKKQAGVVELKTVDKKNELEEKPDAIALETNVRDYDLSIQLLPQIFSSLEFSNENSFAKNISFSTNDYVNRSHRWMLLASTSYMNQHSILKSTDTLQTFQKQNANYIDGSLQLLYQFPKAKNLELNFGLGFYELNQNYTSAKEKTVSVFDTTSGIPLVSADKFTDYSTGSEFSRNAFVDFGIGIPIVVCRNFSWNISTGIRTEYLMKYSSTSGATIPSPLYFTNQYNGMSSVSAESLSDYLLNRINPKAVLNTSFRYSLSKHFAFQSGIDSKFSITDRYKKSSSIHQRDLNLGLNAGLIYRF